MSITREVGAREVVSLDGSWQIAFDPDNRGKVEEWPHRGIGPAQRIPIEVPSIWNLIKPGYEGVAFYQKEFHAPDHWRAKSTRLEFDAANYFAEVWVNGSYIGAHEGGYTPFDFGISRALRYGRLNELIVRVVDPPQHSEIDGIRMSASQPGEVSSHALIPCSKESCYYHHGGIWGSVRLAVSHPIWCRDAFVQPEIYGRKAKVLATIQNDTSEHQEVRVSVRLLAAEGGATREWSTAVEVGPGSTVVEAELEAEHLSLWSLEEPSLSRCCVDVSLGGQVVDSHEVTFGMRHFTVKDGQFKLNGEPVFLKGVLFQPSYPKTLIYPPTPEMAKRELSLIKEAGFNLVRAHLKPFPPYYLDLADRLGLLVYEEPPSAWMGKSARLVEHCERELREMVDRDRNHPSVVLWGVFNEKNQLADEFGPLLMEFAHSLDPTRPIMENSGGSLAFDATVGWTGTPHVYLPEAHQAVEIHDVHPYVAAPVNGEAYNWLNSIGKPEPIAHPGSFGYADGEIFEPWYSRVMAQPGKLFVSEFGYGGLPDLEAVVEAYGEDRHLLDYREMKMARDKLAQGLAVRGLTQRFGGVKGMALACQEVQAQGMKRQVHALRTNTHISGFVVTQLNDASWELNAGILDAWRNPKKVYASLCEALSPNCLVLKPSARTIYTGSELAVEATVVGEAAPPGPCHLQVTAVDGLGSQFSSHRLPVNWGSGITELGQVTIPIPEQEGCYRIKAELVRDATVLCSAEETIMALPRIDLVRLASAISLASEDGRVSAIAPGLSLGCQDNERLIVVSIPSALGADEWAEVISWVRKGGKAVVFGLDNSAAKRMSALPDFGCQVEVYPSLGCWLGCFHYILAGPAFAGLPSDCIANEEYAEIMPHCSMSELEGQILAGAFRSTALFDRARELDFVWYADIQMVKCGRGKVLFCQYRVIEGLGREPLADILFSNLLRYAQSF